MTRTLLGDDHIRDGLYIGESVTPHGGVTPFVTGFNVSPNVFFRIDTLDEITGAQASAGIAGESFTYGVDVEANTHRQVTTTEYVTIWREHNGTNNTLRVFSEVESEDNITFRIYIYHADIVSVTNLLNYGDVVFTNTSGFDPDSIAGFEAQVQTSANTLFDIEIEWKPTFG